LALIWIGGHVTDGSQAPFASGGLLAGGPSPAADSTPLEVSLIESPSPAWEEKLDQKDKEKIEELKKEEDDTTPPGHIVDLPKPALEVRPDSADFASQYDSKVEKETKSNLLPAPGKARSAGGSTGEDSEQSQRQEILSLKRSTGGGKTSAPGKALAMREKGQPEPPGFEDGKSLPEKDGYGSPRGRAPQLKAGTRSEAGAPPGLEGQATEGGEEGSEEIDLRPSREAMARAVGLGSSDYLPDVDEGSQTLLNSKRWKYASFFNRVQRAVYVNWHPDVVYSRRDPTRQIYGQKNRYTVLKVTLRPDGTIRDILVEKPCGVDFLDDEAVSAMRESQPFPNPPEGLINKESQLITFKFGFFFEIESPSSPFRILRYSN
jgi:TonB family protein